MIDREALVREMNDWAVKSNMDVPVIDVEQAVRIAEKRVAEERERCARIARDGCLVPPDGGSPTEEEAAMCDVIAAAIRAGEPAPAVQWTVEQVKAACRVLAQLSASNLTLAYIMRAALEAASKEPK